MTHSRNFRLIVVAFFAIAGLVLGKPGNQEEQRKLAPLYKASFLVEIQPNVDADGQAIPVTKDTIENTISILSQRLKKSETVDSRIKVNGLTRISIDLPTVPTTKIPLVRETILRTAKLELKEVHVDSRALGEKVQAGSEICPPGYKLYLFPILDEDNKKIGERPMLLSRRNIVGGDRVQTANAVPGQHGVLSVLLTKDGGKRLSNVTEKMRKGVDRIAIVLDDKGIIAPVVQANLSRNFVIQGLDGEEEVRQLVMALNNPLRHQLKILSEKIVPIEQTRKKNPKN